MKIDPVYYIEAVSSLCGGGVGGPVDGPLSSLNFDDSGNLGVKAGHTLPTESEIQTELVRLQAEQDALKYSRDRASAYDSIGNQLDMLMKDMRDGTTTHQESCEAVKAKYPKPE